MKTDDAIRILDAELTRSLRRGGTASQEKHDWEEALRMASQTLRGKLPVKVKAKQDKPDELGFYRAVCPNCISEVFRLRDEEPEKHCITCGQWLDWQ